MAKNEDYTPDEMSEMIAQCADALRAEFEAEAAALAKSAKDEPADETSGSSGPSAPVEESPEGTPPAEETPGEGSPSASASPDAGSAPPESPVPPEASASAAPDGGAIEPAPTVEALQAEYMKLPPDQKRIHYLAAKAALVADMGAQGGPAGSPAPAASPSPAPPVTGSPSPAPMAMGEMGAGKKLPGNPGNGGKVTAGKLGKSEMDVEVESLRKRLDEKDQELKAQTDAVEKLTKAVTALATPTRQSIKSLSDIRVIARTEEPESPVKPEVAKMSKSEIQAKLCERIRGGKLSKADKDKISEYTAGGLDVSKIAHLLVDAK